MLDARRKRKTIFEEAPKLLAKLDGYPLTDRRLRPRPVTDRNDVVPDSLAPAACRRSDDSIGRVQALEAERNTSQIHERYVARLEASIREELQRNRALVDV